MLREFATLLRLFIQYTFFFFLLYHKWDSYGKDGYLANQWDFIIKINNKKTGWELNCEWMYVYVCIIKLYGQHTYYETVVTWIFFIHSEDPVSLLHNVWSMNQHYGHHLEAWKCRLSPRQSKSESAFWTRSAGDSLTH